MMSALEGGGGLWKKGRNKGGSVNFNSNCRKGVEGVKISENFADVVNGSPLRHSLPSDFFRLQECRRFLPSPVLARSPICRAYFCLEALDKLASLPLEQHS